MTLPHQVKLKDDRIRIHLAGPGFGEALLIVIGQKIAIGLDCCFPFIQEKDGQPSYVERQIAGMDSDPYLYWMISHFHLDHFLSFNTVLDLFDGQFESIVVPSGYTVGDFDSDRLYYETKTTMRSEAYGDVALDHFEMIQSALTRESLKFVVSDSCSKQTWINTQLVLPNRKKISLLVEYYGTSYGAMKELKGRAASKMIGEERNRMSSGSTKRKKLAPRSNANHGSYILHVRAGEFEGVFLGDTLTNRTLEMLLNRGETDAKVICLKVAHHGSRDGTSDELLERLCDTGANYRERCALIAPFRLHKLPTGSVKSMLRNRSFDVQVASETKPGPAARENILRECPPQSTSVARANAPDDAIIANSWKLC